MLTAWDQRLTELFREAATETHQARRAAGFGHVRDIIESLGEQPDEVALLEQLVAEHTLFIGDGTMGLLCEILPPAPDRGGAEMVHLLHAIGDYDAMSRAETKDWQSVLSRFLEVPTRTLLVNEFYRHNYIMLCRRNLGLHSDFKMVAEIAFKSPIPEMYRLLGFVYYNLARALIKDDPQLAFGYYNLSGVLRFEWLNHLRLHYAVDSVQVRRAATQVWKVGKDVGKLFGSGYAEKCSVDPIAVQNLEGNYDLNFSFSAVK